MGGIQMPDQHRQALARQMGTFAAGYPLVGSHRTVAEKMATLSRAGVDGLCVVWLNYEQGLPDFIANVLPHLERLGVRDAYRPNGPA